MYLFLCSSLNKSVLLLYVGLRVTNIYRLPGNAERIEKLRNRIDQGEQLPYMTKPYFKGGNFMVVFAAEL